MFIILFMLSVSCYAGDYTLDEKCWAKRDQICGTIDPNKHPKDFDEKDAEINRCRLKVFADCVRDGVNE